MSNNQNKKAERLTEMFKALSNPHRLKIFMRLTKCCDLAAGVDSEKMKRCVGQIGKDLNIVPSTVSHHIKELKRAGLVRMQRKGRNINCWIDKKTLETISQFFIELNSK